MDAGQLANFEVVLEDDQLVLKQTGPMPEEALEYLRRHLARLKKFKPVGTWRGARSVSFFDPPLPHPSGKRGLVDRLERVFLRTRKPAAATLAVTYDCQADCVHCSCSRNVRACMPLDTAAWQRIIRDTVACGTTNTIFTGGEPLLRDDICELIATVDPDLSTTLMFTNGELLSPDMARRLADAGLYAMFISLDSPRAEVHDERRRRPGLFEKIMENLQNVKKAGVMVGFSIYLSHDKHQAGELQAYMELAREVGAAELICFDAIPTGRYFGKMDMLLTPKDREEIRALTFRYYKDPDYPSLTTQAHVNSPQSMGCFGAFNQFYMTAYGDMCPCDFTPISFGNAVEEGVATVWKRMTTHPLWCRRHKDCRMQTPEFRACTVDLIPEGAPMPYPIQELEKQLKAHGHPECVSAAG